MNTENTWTPIQSFSIGTVKIGGDAVKVEEPKEVKGTKSLTSSNLWKFIPDVK